MHVHPAEVRCQADFNVVVFVRQDLDGNRFALRPIAGIDEQPDRGTAAFAIDDAVLAITIAPDDQILQKPLRLDESREDFDIDQGIGAPDVVTADDQFR